MSFLHLDLQNVFSPVGYSGGERILIVVTACSMKKIDFDLAPRATRHPSDPLTDNLAI